MVQTPNWHLHHLLPPVVIFSWHLKTVYSHISSLLGNAETQTDAYKQGEKASTSRLSGVLTHQLQEWCWNTIGSDKGKEILTGLQQFHCMSHLYNWSFSFLALYFGPTCEPSFLPSVFDLWLFCFVLFFNVNAVLCAVLSHSVEPLWDPMDCGLPGSSFHGESQGKNTGVACHALLQGSNPGLLVTGGFFTIWAIRGSPRILEWVAYPFYGVSSPPRNGTGVSCTVGGFFTSWMG